MEYQIAPLDFLAGEALKVILLLFVKWEKEH
jgi:hypothetical protein